MSHNAKVLCIMVLCCFIILICKLVFDMLSYILQYQGILYSIYQVGKQYYDTINFTISVPYDGFYPGELNHGHCSYCLDR